MILTYKYRLKGRRALPSTSPVRLRCKPGVELLRADAAQDPAEPEGRTVAEVALAFRSGDARGGDLQGSRVHAQSIQSICDQFVKSRNLHKQCPKFRRSGGPKRSLGWIPFQQQSRKITASSVTYLGNTYRFFGAKRRPLPEAAKGGCFVEDARGRWWVCFQVEVADLPLAPDQAVGIDLGLKTLMTLSTGEKSRVLVHIGLWRTSCDRSAGRKQEAGKGHPRKDRQHPQRSHAQGHDEARPDVPANLRR